MSRIRIFQLLIERKVGKLRRHWSKCVPIEPKKASVELEILNLGMKELLVVALPPTEHSPHRNYKQGPEHKEHNVAWFFLSKCMSHFLFFSQGKSRLQKWPE